MKFINKVLIIFNLLFLAKIFGAENKVLLETNITYIDPRFYASNENRVKAFIDKAALDLFVSSCFLINYGYGIYDRDYVCSQFTNDMITRVSLEISLITLTEFVYYAFDKAKFYYENQVSQRIKLLLNKKFFGSY